MENTFVKLSSRAMAVGLILLALSLATVAAAVFWPLSLEATAGSNARLQRIPSIPESHKSWTDLQTTIMNQDHELIKPLQSIAAVKDDGAAARMAQRLKLQGIVYMGGQYVAYVAVDKDPSAASLKAGMTVLEFTVVSVEASTITLSREGVQIVLP